MLWIVGTLIGTGLVGAGGGVEEQGDGLFSDTATLIAPDGPAFSIWSVIYLFLAAYVVWQWLPRSDGSPWALRTQLPSSSTTHPQRHPPRRRRWRRERVWPAPTAEP